jgi:hypothetical protein
MVKKIIVNEVAKDVFTVELYTSISFKQYNGLEKAGDQIDNLINKYQLSDDVVITIDEIEYGKESTSVKEWNEFDKITIE